MSLFRIKSVDMRYQVWKWGVIFTDNVSKKDELHKESGRLILSDGLYRESKEYDSTVFDSTDFHYRHLEKSQ